MTANDLYLKKPEKVTRELDGYLWGHYFNHVPEIVDHYSEAWTRNNRVEIYLYKDFNLDHRRIWRLASVWFYGAPVMVIQNAGREGDDHAKRFVTNVAQYEAMVAYLRSLLPPDAHGHIADVWSPEVDIPNLDIFYGYHIDEVNETVRRNHTHPVIAAVRALSQE